MKLILSLLLTVSITVLGPVAATGTTLSQVTNNSYEDSLPRIKGDYLVWQAHIDGDWEVFFYNIPTQETTQITSNDYHDLSPQTDGNYVVWQGFDDGEWDIFLWDGSQRYRLSQIAVLRMYPHR